ncbi:MAG: hypothetical protein V7603_3987 [Micromonosporaceae bacterium]
MIELDDRLRMLRDEARERAKALRRCALDLDRDPDLAAELVDLPGIRYLATTMIPPEYQPHPLRLGSYTFYGMRCLERVVAVEELARGDAGGMLAAPGPSLSGVIVHELADPDQKRWYYDRLLDRPTWTFFALTEPDRGSDAGQLRTTLTRVPGGWSLHGHKRYIGNGVRAPFGVVVARHGAGPLAITAVVVDTAAPGFAAEPIPTVGLRAARLSALTFDGVYVPDEMVLGRHLTASRRGMRAAVRTFNQLRPGVAALALGVAAAATDYVRQYRPRLTTVEQAVLIELEQRIVAVRQLVYRAAIAVDRDTGDGYLGSAAKARAAALAEDATLAAPRFFGPGALLDHPVLDKLARDARGFEFMEGTSNIQRLNLFQGFTQGRLANV